MPQPAEREALDHDNRWGWTQVDLPDWLGTRLAASEPVAGGVFRMPADDADPADGASWPVHAGEFPLWPENGPIFDFFCSLHTQWQFAGMDGARVGLMYQSVDFVAKCQRFRFTPERFAELQACEAAALAAWAYEREAKART